MRSKIEANEYKDYILGFIFYKYLSDKEEQDLYNRGYDADNIKEYVNEEADDSYSSMSSLKQDLQRWGINILYFYHYSLFLLSGILSTTEL